MNVGLSWTWEQKVPHLALVLMVVFLSFASQWGINESTSTLIFFCTWTSWDFSELLCFVTLSNGQYFGMPWKFQFLRPSKFTEDYPYARKRIKFFWLSNHKRSEIHISQAILTTTKFSFEWIFSLFRWLLCHKHLECAGLAKVWKAFYQHSHWVLTTELRLQSSDYNFFTLYTHSISHKISRRGLLKLPTPRPILFQSHAVFGNFLVE